MNTRKNVTLWLALFVLVSLACGWINGVSPLSGNPPAGSNATQPPAMNVATPLSGNPPAGDLSGTEMLQIERVSFAAYPWRMTTTVLVKETGETAVSVVEAQSPTTVHTQAVQTIEGDDVTIDAILIDSNLYMKGTGGPAEYYALYGAVEGQWMPVPPEHEFYDYAELARLAADPVSLLDTLLGEGFAGLLAGMQDQVLTPAGSESVFGMMTNIYEYAGPIVTYRWWIGPDQRLYRLTTDSTLSTTTIRVEYDSSIRIEAPLP